MVLQTTRERWASEGPFEAYDLQGPVQRDIPESFVKAAEWRVHNGIEQYHAKSNAPEESSSECWYPEPFRLPARILLEPSRLLMADHLPRPCLEHDIIIHQLPITSLVRPL
jgi:hypothetical protein